MMIIGCDLHTRYQQIAMVDTETGELVERRLEHESGEARVFYASLRGAARVGIGATGHTPWFEAMLSELGHELWMGDAAKIRAAVVRKQKTDARDAAHLLDMLCTNRFPKIWRPSLAERDLRQLLWHRQKLVWMRGAVKNQMHALAMGEGVCRKKKLFTKKGRVELEGLKLGPWASYRRQELLGMFDELQRSVDRLDQAVELAVQSEPLAVRLMTHPGVGGWPGLSRSLRRPGHFVRAMMNHPSQQRAEDRSRPPIPRVHLSHPQLATNSMIASCHGV